MAVVVIVVAILVRLGTAMALLVGVVVLTLLTLLLGYEIIYFLGAIQEKLKEVVKGRSITIMNSLIHGSIGIHGVGKLLMM